MHGYLRMVIALCLLTGSLLATKPVAQAQSNALKQGKMKVIGRYPKKKLKEGKRSFRYHVLEEGNKFRMRVGGPTAVILLVRGFGRNQVTFELNMDGEKEDQVRLQVVKRPKSIYFRVPEGTHEMMVVPSAKVMVRPIPKRRKPRKGEKVVKWKEVIEVASVPLVAPKKKPAAVEPPSPKKRPVAVEPPPLPSSPKKKSVAAELSPSPPPPLVEKPAVPVKKASEVEAMAEQTSHGYSLHVGLKVGGVVPRTDLDFSVGYALLLRLDLDKMLRGAGVYMEVGYALLKNQDESIVPGRGLTNLIQNTHTIPMELGLRYCYSNQEWPIWPYGRLGLALDVSRTTFEAFSTEPVQENDLSPGFGLTAGALIPLGPGGIFLELRYREVWAQMHTMGEIGEDMLSAFSFWAGYQIKIAL